MKYLANFAVATATALLMAGTVHAAPTNLSTWTAEGSGGTWTRAADNNSVTQSVNGDPTVFYSDFKGQGRSLSGTIRVNTASDDDYIGFVLGFDAGELSAASTDFLLIDWKQANQSSYGGTAMKGLALSRVTKGLPDASGAWWHDPSKGVTELSRASTLGSTGWAENRTYTFNIQFTDSNVKVFVDNVLELNVNGSFGDGRFGFYNYSQANVTYAGISDDVLPPGGVPEPATWAMMIAGFGLAGAAMRRRANQSVFA